MAELFGELFEEELGWAAFFSEEGADDSPETYRSLVKERDRLVALQISIAERQRSGGRAPRQENEHKRKHAAIRDDYFGIPAVYDGAGILLEPKVKRKVTKVAFFRRYRMSPHCFNNIHDDIQDPEVGCSAFMGRTDACGREGPSSLQKMTSVMRQLGYGMCCDIETDYTGVRQGTGRTALYDFCQFMIRKYGPEYLGKWDTDEMVAEEEANAARGFPGMIGSIDCCHWEWKNCPIRHQGMFQDRNRKRSIVVEAIAGHDMYIFQAFVGLPGSLNDINIHARTDATRKYSHSTAIDMKFKLANQDFKGAYLLADGIYPRNPYLMKTIPEPATQEDKLFAKVQEALRKDVERAFGRLHAKWHILKIAGRSHSLRHLKNIWLTCIILHNITLRDQQTVALEKKEGRRADRAAARGGPPIEAQSEDVGVCGPVKDAEFFYAHSYEGILGKRKRMENVGVCQRMQKALVDHIWLKFGSQAQPSVAS